MNFRRVSAAAFLFALILAVATVSKARKLDSPDFKVFHTAARFALTEPAKMYVESPDRYLYPPSTALLLTPIGALPYTLAQWLWHGGLALVLFLLAGRAWATLVAFALLTRYLAITFGYGQINLFVIGLMALAGRWREAGARLPASGAVWALATSLKVYPAVFAPAYLQRRTAFAWAGVVAAGCALLALPFLVYGPFLGLDLYRGFFHSLSSKGLPLHSHNQSFTALLSRLFTDAEFYLHAVGPVRWTWFALPPGLVRAFALLVGAALTFLTWRKTLREGRAPLSAAAFSILFLSHIVWKDYFLWLFFPLAEFLARSQRARAIAVGGIYLAALTLSAHDVVGAEVSTRLDGACIHLWAAILVWGAWWKTA